MMDMLKYMSFEINDLCPLEVIHPQCPRNKDRFELSPHREPITVEDIVSFYRYCREYERFRGMINLHNYNEPLMTPDIILALMERLPEAEFSLWTNGVLLGSGADIIRIIERCAKVMVTIYPETDIETVIKFQIKYPNLKRQFAKMDRRAAEDAEPKYWKGMKGCNRVNYDPVIDYYGNMHMCCADWRGEIALGNIKRDAYLTILEKWEDWRKRLSAPINEDSYYCMPLICQKCLVRTPYISRVN